MFSDWKNNTILLNGDAPVENLVYIYIKRGRKSADHIHEFLVIAAVQFDFTKTCLQRCFFFFLFFFCFFFFRRNIFLEKKKKNENCI